MVLFYLEDRSWHRFIYAGIIFVEAVRWSASCEEKRKAERERLKKGDIKIRDFTF